MTLSRFGFLLLVEPFRLAVSSTCRKNEDDTMLLQLDQDHDVTPAESAAPEIREQVEKPSKEPAKLWDLASAPAIPKTPGCYAWIPSGCPLKVSQIGADAYATWRRDDKGNQSASECKARAAALDHWCGSSDAQTTFVAKDPKTPGCYAWRPLGCPNQQTDAYDSWRGDDRGRASFNTCKAREASFDRWCGSQGTRMRFVPKSGDQEKSMLVTSEQTHSTLEQVEKDKREYAALENLVASAPPLKKTPGCYAWIPSGCPKQEAKDAYANWRGDEKGRQNASACKARAAALNHWCGSTDAQMAFVAEAPKKPGCYAWMPFGCPKKHLDNFDTWAADHKGDESFRICKERGAELDRYCGTKGTLMNFVQ